MKQWHKFLFSLVAVAALAACGGGGDDEESGDAGGDAGTPNVVAPAAAADKYVGTWLNPCTDIGGGKSEKEVFTIAKTSATEFTVAVEFTTYTNSTCAGAGVPVNAAGTVKIDGQTTLTYAGQPQTFDQLTATIPGEGTLKWTGTVLANGKMVIDFDDNDVSGPTYPVNPNEGQSVYTRQ